MSEQRDTARMPQPDPGNGEQTARQELLAAQEALRRANARLEAMLEGLSDAFCAVDRQWRITWLNGRALELLAPLERSRADLIGADLWAEFPELRGSVLGAAYTRAMESDVTVTQEFFFERLNAWFEVRVYPSPEGLALYFQDISSRKADRQALIDGNARLQLALSAGGLGDWRWDAASDRVTLGARAAGMLGLPAETPLQWQVLRTRLDEPDRERVRRAFLQAFATHSEL
ncbi:MAG TPA: PAS domain-containing protein, partial [Telluria sp.]|nr:PAS domain-containing protein [Telluria sp.]